MESILLSPLEVIFNSALSLASVSAIASKICRFFCQEILTQKCIFSRRFGTMFARAIFVPKKFLRFGTRFAASAILAGRAADLPFWQLLFWLATAIMSADRIGWYTPPGRGRVLHPPLVGIPPLAWPPIRGVVSHLQSFATFQPRYQQIVVVRPEQLNTVTILHEPFATMPGPSGVYLQSVTARQNL